MKENHKELMNNLEELMKILVELITKIWKS